MITKVKNKTTPSFREQAEMWLRNGQKRKRNPLRPETVKTYKSQIETNLNPNIGVLAVDSVGNKEVKELVAILAAKGLSASTIQLNVNIIKQIRSSIVNSEGEQVYPYKWNTEFMDLPIVDKNQQKRPVASAQTVQDAFKCTSKAPSHTQALLVVLAGSGLRIQEALALTMATNEERLPNFNYWVPSESKIVVFGQRDGQRMMPPKTKAGIREVDLPSELNDYLKRHFRIENGLMFPESESFYRREFAKCGILGGFHSLRRFRVTHLRMQGVPDSLVHFWIGHEDSTVTGRYTEVGTEIEARREAANKAGLGFNLDEPIRGRNPGL